MTKKELMAVVDNQLPADLKCVRIRYRRFSKNEYENGAHFMGIFVEPGNFYLMAWFRVHEVDLTIHKIVLSLNDNEIRLIRK